MQNRSSAFYDDCQRVAVELSKRFDRKTRFCQICTLSIIKRILSIFSLLYCLAVIVHCILPAMLPVSTFPTVGHDDRLLQIDFEEIVNISSVILTVILLHISLCQEIPHLLIPFMLNEVLWVGVRLSNFRQFVSNKQLLSDFAIAILFILSHVTVTYLSWICFWQLIYKKELKDCEAILLQCNHLTELKSKTEDDDFNVLRVREPSRLTKLEKTRPLLIP